MTRNQLPQHLLKDLSANVMFTVASNGDISPITQQTIAAGEKILTQATPAPPGSSTPAFSGHVCARQNDVCKCSTLTSAVSSGAHMELGIVYTISAPVNSDFELYAVTDSGPIASATNGDIRVGG